MVKELAVTVSSEEIVLTWFEDNPCRTKCVTLEQFTGTFGLTKFLTSFDKLSFNILTRARSRGLYNIGGLQKDEVQFCVMKLLSGYLQSFRSKFCGCNSSLRGSRILQVFC